MTFNSLQFAVFFPVVLAVYWRLSRRPQNALLLVASYVFYGVFDVRFLGLLWLSTLLDYWFGRSLAASEEARARTGWLIASLVVNLGILGTFKYFDFFSESFAGLLSSVGLDAHAPALNVLLPVGISFYTFHGISYVFDVYRRRIEPSKSLLDYGVFVAFFPQLVAGPIGRATIQLPQFATDRRRPDRAETADAVQLILVGLFKKVAIADAVAPFVLSVFSNPGSASAPALLGAAWAFSLQIYGDFSGYTDMARGTARLLGINLPENFRQPYLSRSITEFWRRWHISLSNWLRDYLYIPMGGGRGKPSSVYRNLMVTMLLGGLWHGAAWTFVVWGGMHGALLAVERALHRDEADVERPPRWHQLPDMILAVGYWTASMVFFRADSFATAGAVFKGIVTAQTGANFGAQLLLVMAATVAVGFVDLAQRRAAGRAPFSHLSSARLGAVCGVMVVAIAVFSGGRPVPFIYFQF